MPEQVTNCIFYDVIVKKNTCRKKSGRKCYNTYFVDALLVVIVLLPASIECSRGCKTWAGSPSRGRVASAGPWFSREDGAGLPDSFFGLGENSSLPLRESGHGSWSPGGGVLSVRDLICGSSLGKRTHVGPLTRRPGAHSNKPSFGPHSTGRVPQG